MLRFLLVVITFLGAYSAGAQTNIFLTNTAAHDVLTGNFGPNDYAQSTVINHPTVVLPGLVNQLNADSMRVLLEELSAIPNRNTGSDTSSNNMGIGAARRWAYQRFQQYSAANENRLLVSYVQFDDNICGVGQHRNIIGVLPGTGNLYDEVVLVEAHIDSRCEDVCDSLCDALGMEDNGSGTALVMELARVMSGYSYNRTIVFMLTIGEEQGLFGAEAMATYCEDNNVKLNAVFNNDVIGGVICGQTASPPGCPGLNDVDSINVRLYSLGNFNSHHKSLARYTKLEYQENIESLMTVQTIINIMSPEDRSGRGGDHMPFRAHGYPSIRFTSANEHGHGGPDSTYTDRQHTVNDILGVDTNNDQVIDSFFVDFNYLNRNGMINANAIACAAMGPIPPTDLQVTDVPDGLEFTITDPNNYGQYRIGVRSTENDFDTVLTFTNTVDTIWGLTAGPYYRITACTVDSNGIESLFSEERVDNFAMDLIDLEKPYSNVQLLQNKPNPFDEATTISVHVDSKVSYERAEIVVMDIQGRETGRFPISLENEMNEVLYRHDHHQFKTGVYSYSLVIDGQLVATRQMIFAF